ncbi:HEAT repeat domain-containing protein, partial [Candidatus Ozemobacteraceae bacterium]|nr:HEAT repeat domain-containing protein [Candidatus Ozemobacteraceae bacterium]
MIPKRQQDLIIQNLRSISAEVRLRSVSQIPSLSISGEEKAKLLSQMLEDADEGVRSSAKRMLDEIGCDGVAPAEKAAPPVLEPNAAVQLPAVSDDIPEIDTSLLKPTGDASKEAAGRRGTKPLVIEAPFLNEQVDPSLPDPEKMKSIPEMLEHTRVLVRNRPPGHLTQLLWLSRQVHEEVALTALQGLLTIKDPRIPPQVLPFLVLTNFSSQRRFLVLKIIMETSSALEVEQLEQVLLNEKDVIVKSGLVKVYARLAGEQGVPTIRVCLTDSDARVRANTVEVIEECSIRSCEADVEKLLRDPENRVKVNAAKFLVKCGHPEAFSTLRSMLRSSEVWLRDSVIFALGEIGDQASLTLLKAALKDTNQGIRLSVLKALAKINNTVAREALLATTEDSDSVVAQVARGLWEKIKNTPLREPVAQVVAPTPAETELKPVSVGPVGAPPVALITPAVQPSPEADFESQPETLPVPPVAEKMSEPSAEKPDRQEVETPLEQETSSEEQAPELPSLPETKAPALPLETPAEEVPARHEPVA